VPLPLHAAAKKKRVHGGARNAMPQVPAEDQGVCAFGMLWVASLSFKPFPNSKQIRNAESGASAWNACKELAFWLVAPLSHAFRKQPGLSA
jgi:hypothetical protein